MKILLAIGLVLLFSCSSSQGQECTDDTGCDNDKACIKPICMDLCKHTNQCTGSNTECKMRDHKIRCVCKLGFTNKTEAGCVPGCNKNEECFENQTCNKQKCVDLCESCLEPSQECIVHDGHTASCQCAKGYKKTTAGCVKKCSKNGDCLKNQTCNAEECVDVCEAVKCTEKQFQVCVHNNNHTASCQCLEGYRSSTSGCVEIKKCSKNGDCFKSQTCNTEECVDVCEAAKCTEKPFQMCVDNNNHTASCQCSKGYNKTTAGCVKIINPPERNSASSSIGLSSWLSVFVAILAVTAKDFSSEGVISPMKRNSHH